MDAPITTAPVVSKIGVVRTAPALNGSFKSDTIFQLNLFNEIDQQDRFCTITPAKAIIPIKEVAVK